MRVVSKFAILYFLVSCAIFVAIAYRAARMEALRLEASATTDLQGLGYGLTLGVTKTWAAAGKDAALAIIEAPDTHKDAVRITWIPGPETVSLVGIPRQSTRRADALVVRLPVQFDGAYVGDLELRRELPTERSILVAQLVNELPFALLLACVLALLAVLVGGAVIGRPLQRIVAQARRIGTGDFSQRLIDSRRDEIGDLKRELNVMCAQLDDARKKLEEESAGRTETLEQLRHLDRLRTVGTIASSLAHELGTPLNVLLIRGQELTTHVTNLADVEDAGRTIVAQVEKMSRLVRQLLDFSRRKPSSVARVSARALAERAVHILHAVANKHNVRLEVAASEDDWVEGEDGQLEQALTNLVVNSIQATPAGGRVVVRVEREDGIYAPGSARKLDVVAIRVEDTGSGIPKDELEHLFEPFYTTKARGVGTGLGLSVAKGIVEDFGGWISATSEVTKGSVFCLHLPRAT